MSTRAFHLVFVLLIGAFSSLWAQPPRVTVGVECEQFQFPGDWTISSDHANQSGAGFLTAGAGAPWPAVTAVPISKAGQYTLWVRSLDFPNDRPGTRYFSVAIGVRVNSKPFGKSGQAGWNWEKGDVFALAKGSVLLAIRDNERAHYGRVDALLLCDDPSYVPRGTLPAQGILAVKPILLKAEQPKPAVTVSPLDEPGGGPPLGRLENEHLRLSFVAARRGNRPSARPMVEVQTGAGWVAAPVDPAAESYQALSAPSDATMELHFFPRWKLSGRQTVVVASGGARVETRNPAVDDRVIWNAGQGHEYIIRKATQLDSHRVELDFYPTAAGGLRAVWELPPGAKTARVEMTFTPAADGQYSLGYFLFQRQPLSQVQELLLPMLVQRKRFPTRDYTLLEAECPTPVSLMQVAGGEGVLTYGVSADPAFVPFRFPIPEDSRCGLHIRSPQGQVQPSIYGPLVGAPGARARAGEPVRFAFRVIVQPGDWYAAYRTVADEVFGWRDYRANGAVSLTQAALNMIDLYLDDNYGGWWDRAKGPFQIETKNGATQSTPLTAVSLYRLTGDTELFRRRTLPTLEYMLSRDGPHFSPIPEDTGSYPKGSMNGPVRLYGTTTFGGLWEMMNHRTPVFRDLALPDDGIRTTLKEQNWDGHLQPFDEWLGRYLYTGDKSALARAIQEADDYISKAILAPPTRELGTAPFFLISFTPDWEGLLRLYEVTKEKRFLDAAVQGAHLVMTGIWTQPTPAAEDITLNPGGHCRGDLPHLSFYKGGEKFRLGWPPKPGDTPEKKVPAWLVSNVGLGFEQPSTYAGTDKDNGGRMIFQAPWASGFLRLAQYTGDKQFETYSRNAVAGRWSNYPGYYYAGFTDLAQNPRYPYEGPDMGFFYYHHIAVHLSWVIDYLVSEAALRSGGAIHFPSLRQFGYAYFDNLIYGHAPGEILGASNAWLWVRKDLVALDNPQINYLTAHTRNQFFVILMNEASRMETVNVTFQPANISKGLGQFTWVRVHAGHSSVTPIHQNTCRVAVESRGLTVLEADGLDIDVPAHRLYPDPRPSRYPGFAKVASENGLEARAAAIQIEPGPWQAYVWSTAGSRALKEMSLDWTIGRQTGTVKTTEYPYEFSVPVPAGQDSFRFTVSGLKSDGTPFKTKESIIGVGD